MSGPSLAADLGSLPVEALQPRTFEFPKRSFRKKVVANRSFQPLWFEKCPWLHYTENDDAVVCFTCAGANWQKKLQWSANLELTFISKGFTNWKDATVKFAIHASSKCHKEAVLKMITFLDEKCGWIFVNPSNERKVGAMAVLLEVLSNVRFLAWQGLPFRGHGDHEWFQFPAAYETKEMIPG